jgi:hypothetical protein
MYLRFRLGKESYDSACIHASRAGPERGRAPGAAPGRLLSATIVVARDPAFHSYHPDYLQLLQAIEQAGARRTRSALGLNSRCLI